MKVKLALLLVCVALPLSAQRAMHAASGPHFGGSHGFAPMRQVPHAASRSYFSPGIGSFYPDAYYPSNFVAPSAYTSTPYPEGANGGPMVIVSPSANDATNVVYIPSYMRPQSGPSLGEIAAQLKAQKHESAKYVWKNVEPMLPAKDDVH